MPTTTMIGAPTVPCHAEVCIGNSVDKAEASLIIPVMLSAAKHLTQQDKI